MASFPQFANFHVVADVCTALQGTEWGIATGEADDGHWFWRWMHRVLLAATHIDKPAVPWRGRDPQNFEASIQKLLA